MSKVLLNEIQSLANTASAKAALNENFDNIEEALNDTLSRSGQTPNQMEADIDLNGNDLLNVGVIDADNYLLNGTPLLQTVAYGNKLYETFDGTGAQQDYLLQVDPGSLGNLEVSVEGVMQRPGIDYNFSGTTLHFVVAPVAGTDNILVRYDQALPNGVGDSGSILYTPPSTGILGSVKNFLDSLWGSGSSDEGADLIRYPSPQGVIASLKAFLDSLYVAGVSTGAALIRFLQRGTNTEAQTVQQKLQERVSVLDFIPEPTRSAVIAGTNTADLAPYITNAINSRPGQYLFLYFPPYSYRLDTPVEVLRGNLILEGEKAEILWTPSSGNWIELGDGITDYSDIAIRGFLFAANQVQSSGSIIRARRYSIAEIANNLVYGLDRIFHFVDWTVGFQINVHGNFSERILGNHLTFRGTGAGADRVVDMTIYDNRFDYGQTAAYFDVYSEGIFYRRNIALRQTNLTVGVIGSALWTIASVKLQENDFDGGVAGLSMEYASTSQITDNWFSSNTGTNITLGANVGNVIGSSNQIYALPGQTCVSISADNTVWTGNFFSGGAQGYVVNAGAVGFTATGNGVNNMTGSAVNLFANPDRITVVGNTFLANVTGVSAGGTNLNVANNLTA